MTDLQILTTVRDNGGSMEYTALLNHGLSYPNHDSLADMARIEKLIEDKHLLGKTEAYSTIALRKHGRLYLQALQQEETQRTADEKRQQKFSSQMNAMIAAARSQAEAAEIQAELARKKAKKADIKGIIALIISTCGLLLELLLNYREIIDFFKSI